MPPTYLANAFAVKATHLDGIPKTAYALGLTETQLLERVVQPWENGTPLVLSGLAFAPGSYRVEIRHCPVIFDKADQRFSYEILDGPPITDLFITAAPGSDKEAADAGMNNDAGDRQDDDLPWVGIAGVVFGALALIGNQRDLKGFLLVGFGLSATVLIVRIVKRAGLRDRLQAVAVAFGLIFMVLYLVAGDGDDENVDMPAPSGKAVTIFNKVTDGPRAMREDAPLRLFFSPALCRSQDCLVPGSGFHTGNKIDDVVCQVRGDRIVNGTDRDDSDDRNPQLFPSRLWYGVRTESGRLAYFSEVWAHPHQRGGLSLPDCSSAAIDIPG